MSDQDRIKMLDLKGKVGNLIQAGSEVLNYLNVKLPELDTLSVSLREYSLASEKVTTELKSYEKARDQVKQEYESVRDEMAAWKAERTKEIDAISKSANQDRQEAANLLDSVKLREAQLEIDKAEFDKNRRIIESRNEKIKELVGGR